MVRWRFSIAVVSLLAVLALAAFLVWLLGTTAGANWAIRQIAAITPVSIRTAAVHGRIAGGLQVDELEILSPAGEVRIHRIDWRMSPAKLLAGTLAWTDLTLRQVAITLAASAPKPAEPAAVPIDLRQLRQNWPGWTDWLDLRIDHLQLEELRISKPGTDPFSLNRLLAGVEWSAGRLTLAVHEFAAPGGTVEAKLTLVPEALQGELTVGANLVEPWNRIKGVAASWQFTADKNRNLQAVGTLTLEGAEARLFTIDSRLVVTAKQLKIVNVHADQAGRPGSLDLEGVFGWGSGATASHWNGQVTLQQLDLAGWGLPLNLTGEIGASGENGLYGGNFDLLNADPRWQVTALAGELSGSRTAIRLSALDGEMLQGVFSGKIDVDWEEELRLRFDLQGRQIDPLPDRPEVAVRLNLDLQGGWSSQPQGGAWQVEARLLPSDWRGHTIDGSFAATGLDTAVRLEGLQLRGDGLQLQGAGVLADRLNFDLQVAQLSSWWPGLAGNGAVSGWLQWDNDIFAGRVEGHLGEYASRQLTLDRLQFSVGMQGWLEAVDLSLDAAGVAWRQTLVDDLKFELSGERKRHRAFLMMNWEEGGLQSRWAGSWLDETWQGEIASLDLVEKTVGNLSLAEPASLIVGRRQLRIPNLKFRSAAGEEIELQTDLTFAPLTGTGRLYWQELGLQRLNPWLPLTLTGRSDGEVLISMSADRVGSARIISTAGFDLRKDETILTEAQMHLDGRWDQDGLELSQVLTLADGGRLTLLLASKEGPTLTPPRQGDVLLEWDRLPLGLSQAWLPPKMQVSGLWQGEISGGWQNGQRVGLELNSQMNGVEVSWHDLAGKLVAADLEGRLHGGWNDEAFTLAADFDLSRQGHLAADLTLPLSNRLPFRFNPHGPWLGSLALKAQERGFLAFVLPGLLEETGGEIDLQLRTEGSPAAPRFSGTLSLLDASGHLPMLGIRLDDVDFRARLAEEKLHIEQLSLVSGAGKLQAQGVFALDGWRLKQQQWTLAGADMPLVHLPELELSVSPDLAGSGTGENLEISGRLLVPRMKLRSVTARGQLPVSASSDIVLVDGTSPEQRDWPLKLNAAIRLDLGDQVLVDMSGVDARLSGGIDLKMRSPRDITGSGAVNVEQGTYAGYGLRLPIERGRILFAGDRLDRPSLDILAVKTIGEVKAGVKISGTPRLPLVALYSKPSMPDTDILSYIVLGRPLGADSGQTDMLMLAAGALLSRGESAALQDSLQRRFGLDVIQVNSGDGDVAKSVVTIGKYLRPDLYVSLGYSVFTQTNELRLRYNLTESWELQSNMGEESGADLYYRIDFE